MRNKPLFVVLFSSFLILSSSVNAEIIYESSSSPGYYDDEHYTKYTGKAYTQDAFEDDNDYMQLAYQDSYDGYGPRKKYSQKRKRGSSGSYSSRLPSHISGHGEKVIVIDPNVHAWGAYTANGDLIRSGTATAGARYCPDIRRGCRTKAGTFRIRSLGARSCYSRKYPVGRGGAPMPYCMFFNGGQGLHGSYEVAKANISHGCVRVHVGDAEWIRFNFANIGTKVVVRPY